MGKFDLTFEGTFALGGAPPGGGGGGQIARTVSFSTATYETQEGADLLVVGVLNRAFTVQTNVPILFDDVNSTATLGVDFQWRNGVDYLSFAPNALVAAAQLQALIDASGVEGTESVKLSLSAQGDPETDGWLVGTPGQSQVNIFDVGPPRINFATAETEFFEGSPTPASPPFDEFFVEIALTSPPVAVVTVEVLADYASSTLSFGSDLLAPPPVQVVTFTPGGPLSQFVTIQSVPDVAVEQDEQLTLRLQNVTGVAEIGSQGTHIVRVLNDDALAAVVSFVSATSSMEEGFGVGVFVEVRDQNGDLQAQHGGLRIPIIGSGTANVTPSAPGQDAIIAWPGGTARTVIIPNGQSSAVIGVQSIEDTLTETNETVIFQLAPYNPALNSGAPYTIGTIPTHTSTIVNDDLPNPVVRFSASSVLAVFEQATTAVTVDVEVVDPLATNIGQVFSVELVATGTATLGSDYTILIGNTVASSSVTFQPGESRVTVTIQAVDDLAIESVETIILTLANPTNCTIGTPNTCSGSIISNDAGNGGANLRPQFYFPSEVFGRGPTKSTYSSAAETSYLIADLGPNTLFTEDVVITLRAYSPNAVAGTDYDFTNSPGSTTGTITIQAGQRWGQEPFRVNTSGFIGQQKWVVVEMVSTSHGQVGAPTSFCRWTAVILGSTDTLNLIPPAMSAGAGKNNMPATADYRVYNDRIEDLAHGATITMPLPWPNNWSNPTNTVAWPQALRDQVAAIYGPIVTQGFQGSSFKLMNGVGLAAHLAQQVWIQRNNPSSSINDPNAFGVCDTTANANGIYYIAPHVKWLDRGLGVRVDVMEDMLPVQSQLFFGGDSGHQPNSRQCGMISWNDHHTFNGNFYPGAVRDLWIRGVGGQRTIGEIRLGDVKASNFDSQIGQARRQLFMDNVHLENLRITKPNVQQFPGVTGQYWIFGSGSADASPTGTGLHYGLNYMDTLTFVDQTGAPVSDTYQFRVTRFNNPGSWDLRNMVSCPVQQQFFYIDGHGPIFRLHANTCPAPGVGNGMLQSTQRPKNGGDSDGRRDGPSHGLCAITNNEVHGMAFNGLGGGDMIIYCVTGSVFYQGNKHRGPINGVPGGNAYNRAFLKLNVRGNQAGCYVHETSPGSGEYYGFRYAYIDTVDINVTGGPWGGPPIEISGCENVDLGANTAAIVTGTPLNGSSMIIFGGDDVANIGPSPQNTAIYADPLNNTLFGQAVPGTVNGKPRSRVRLENRGGVALEGPGGVRFLAPYADIIKERLGSNNPVRHLRNARVRWAEEFMALNGAIDPGAPSAPTAYNQLGLAFAGTFTGTDLS